MTTLPQTFLDQMKTLLPADEYAAFYASYENPTVRGLRLNKLKPSDIFNDLSHVPWCDQGRVYPDTDRPAKSIFHQAGLFYIQEPSAMCPAEVLFMDAAEDPAYRVLDLCAAPGGKSAQIAGHLQGKGLLISNDASPSRSRALVKNLERMGVTNAVVTTEMPKKLADRFPAFFDRILVDAPCSGEGMFRRDPEAVKAYTANKPEACVAMQTDILQQAAQMLKPGGRLVYSTCTFNMRENEDMMAAFLDAHRDFTPVPIDHGALGIAPGLGSLPQAGRLFPHLVTGEGHFVALLEKTADSADAGAPDFSGEKGMRVPKEFADFWKENLTCPMPQGEMVLHGVSLYLQPEPLDLRGIRVARSGWHLGEVAKGRFVPSQALAMGLRMEDFVHVVNLSEENAHRYLRGESLDGAGLFEKMPKDKPWVAMCYEGYPLGWARLVQGRLKNNLPVGLVVQ
ncbi:MAG: RsmF rRNA methyltransferase first C-terminal domain-containing protein [Defluviitaleaceae bacterium]|nr:RsmF rRNA methyltransferase first C-terminal domain-containing protein [Defluviitaleaceae bacterium]